MLRIDETNRETLHTMTAWVLIAAGIIAFFTDMLYVEHPEGVSMGTLAFVGETFTLAGALLGIVQYVQGRFNNFARKNNLSE